jgi:hypothetical protein
VAGGIGRRAEAGREIFFFFFLRVRQEERCEGGVGFAVVGGAGGGPGRALNKSIDRANWAWPIQWIIWQDKLTTRLSKKKIS